MSTAPVTARQFAAFVEQAAGGLCREWDEAHGREPEDFPDRLTIEEWWEYFAELVVPDLMAAAAEPPPEAPRAMAGSYQI